MAANTIKKTVGTERSSVTVATNASDVSGGDVLVTINRTVSKEDALNELDLIRQRLAELNWPDIDTALT